MIIRLTDSPRRLTIGLLLILFAALAMIDPAFAQTASSSATSTPLTTGGSVGSFSCSGGQATGVLYDATVSCPTSLQSTNIFSFIVCNMEHLASNLMGSMYCNIIAQLLPAVMAMLVLSVLFFGVGFTIGVIPATARDFQVFLLKMTLIFLFATQSDYLVGFGYNILVTGMREGAGLAVSTMYNQIGGNGALTTTPAGYAATAATGSNNGYAFYAYMDSFLGKTMHFATDYIGKGGTAQACQNAVFAVMAVMAVAFPPIFYIGVMIIFRIGLTFLRAVFAYIYAVVGIVFLLTASPFFLTFALFRTTQTFFERWLAYLVSFGLQVVILFAFLGFVLSINVSNISNSITGIIVPIQETHETYTMRFPWHYCTICDFDVNGPNGQVYSSTTDYTGVDLISTGKLQCHQYAADATHPADQCPGGICPLSVLNTIAPPDSGNTTGNTALSAGAAKSQAIQKALLKFATSALLSLLVLAYILEYILNYVPSLAQILAGSFGGVGATYAPQLAGADPLGQRLSIDVPGSATIDTFEQGFMDGYTSQGIARTSIASTTAGITTAVRRSILGGGGGADPLSSSAGANDPGMVQNFLSFMLGGGDQ